MLLKDRRAAGGAQFVNLRVGRLIVGRNARIADHTRRVIWSAAGREGHFSLKRGVRDANVQNEKISKNAHLQMLFIARPWSAEAAQRAVSPPKGMSFGSNQRDRRALRGRVGPVVQLSQKSVFSPSFYDGYFMPKNFGNEKYKMNIN
jgi:hypothetical protein